MEENVCAKQYMCVCGCTYVWWDHMHVCVDAVLYACVFAISVHIGEREKEGYSY